MPWAQFDDHFHDSVAALEAGPEACGLHLWATCWSGAHLTDGRLPEPIARRFIDLCEHGDELVARLVSAGLWAKAEDGWLSVVGLHWLHPGEQKLGSDPACDILLPARAPAVIIS